MDDLLEAVSKAVKRFQGQLHVQRRPQQSVDANRRADQSVGVTHHRPRANDLPAIFLYLRVPLNHTHVGEYGASFQYTPLDDGQRELNGEPRGRCLLERERGRVRKIRQGAGPQRQPKGLRCHDALNGTPGPPSASINSLMSGGASDSTDMSGPSGRILL